MTTEITTSPLATPSADAPEPIAVQVSGRSFSGTVHVWELMGGELTDSVSDFLAVLFNLRSQNIEISDLATGVKTRADIDVPALVQGCADNIYRLLAKATVSEGETVTASFIRGLRFQSILELVAAFITANTPFFSILLTQLSARKSSALNCVSEAQASA